MAKHMAETYVVRFTDNDIRKTLERMGLAADDRACYDIAHWLMEDFECMLNEPKSVEEYVWMIDEGERKLTDGVEELKEG